ncbi:Glutathionyl-hydroquinone reductase YqjG [Enhygromyxa salina]|uniref:Glutathionyl-hydroquinone reductase YqjG n=1 Tax=Enhygromyxa salina TaxID=215803 RepID=A0A2S9XJG9_9BACT|nr:glutathione S-transferase family protein [Enhygromyxa salina]PRP93029.1 Glutathionyl-hydroquinone reductase YqjG [Enhygromyxa salina]
MGQLVDGKWTTQWYEPDPDGRFVRSEAGFRSWVRAAGEGSFSPADGRYHLYVAWACPWAHRTMIMRALKGLEHAIDVSVVAPFMGDQGWRFNAEVEGATVDKALGGEYLRDVYLAADPRCSGRVTVPVLWDTQQRTIVNNESREIVRMFDHEFGGVARRDVDLAPPALRDEVERLIDFIYEPINNGVYRAGFATKQGAYDEAVTALFEALDHVEGLLGQQRWLAGERMTEVDIFLFTTLIRFDLVYHTHFKCNRKRIVDYPNLWGFVREIYQLPGIAKTCNFDHIRKHYYQSHETINPHRIVAIGPQLDLDAAHGRERLGGVAARAMIFGE